MALKDLVADKAALTEEAIEELIGQYVRYDTDTGEIVFTPDGGALSNERKVLVYLTAALGWQYVTESPPTISTTPASLEEILGIPGGTLRPILKGLKDRHLIVAKDGHYAVRPANLTAIQAIVKAKSESAPRTRVRAKSARPKTEGKKARNGTPKLAGKLDAWIKDGHFGEWRTLSDVHERLHAQGVIVNKTSVSGPLLTAVQAGRLVREKRQVGGKAVWAYHEPPTGNSA